MNCLFVCLFAGNNYMNFNNLYIFLSKNTFNNSQLKQSIRNGKKKKKIIQNPQNLINLN